MCTNVAVKHIFLTLLLIYPVAFSHVDISDAVNIQIFYPRIYFNTVRQKRDLHRNVYFEETRKLKVIEVGDWAVQLNFEDNLLVAPGLKTEWIGANGATRLESLKQCDYKIGAVLGLETTSTAAITLCGGLISGYVDVRGMPYFIMPFNDSGAHLLYNSKTLTDRVKRSQTSNMSFSTDLSASQNWLFNLTGDTIDIGGDKDKIKLEQRSDQDTSSSNEGELDISVAVGNSSTTNDEILQQRRRNWHREQLDDEDSGYFYDSAWTADPFYTYKRGGSNLPSRWLEIALAVDHTVITFHGRNKVEQYVLALMNIVSAIYQDPSLESNLKLVITRLLFYDTKKKSVVHPGNAKRSLESVNSWNRRLHMSLAPGEPRHDLAVWLTKSDIGGPSGYAPVAGVCDPKRSCALNRDEGLSSAFIIAHETAHILGLSHDGDKKTNNNCGHRGPEGSVMAPLVTATFNNFFWSECSKREFRKNTNKWSCLLNSPDGVGEILLNATLQTSFSMDEQCRMEFGDGYSMCRSFDIVEPCSHLWCGKISSPLVCKTKKGPPLEGTECGFSKWCINGYCEEIENRVFEGIPVSLNPQDGGWGDWSPWGRCSRTCGMGVEFQSRKCDNPEPSYGGKSCEGDAEQWRTCNNIPCPEPLSDIRAQQCQRLPKLLNLKKGNLTWLPYESEHDEFKCKFICIAEETKELYETNENLIDGSPCSYENNNNICVQGKCQEIGCDGVLHSGLRRDKCGVCGGNNAECSEIRSVNHKKLKKEVNRGTVLPRMARDIKVGINATMHQINDPAVAFILKNRRKKKYFIAIPNVNVETKIIEGTKFFYKKLNNVHNIWAQGPILAEMIILIYAPTSEIDTGINISVSTKYVIHKHFMSPSKRYVWVMGGWGPCSASCGGGRRQKTTACWDNENKQLVRRKFCSLLQKPILESEKCNTFGCNFQWIAGEWEPCSTTCGTKGVQYRELYCVPKTVLNKMLYYNNGSILDQPWKYMVNPNNCSGTAPASMRFCNREPCFSYWTFGEWSQCSVTCGPGFSTRETNCPPPVNESFFTCGKLPSLQRRLCHGPFNRHNNQLCKGRKKAHCKGDKSVYCSLALLSKYCKINGFRRLCCKSCSNFHLRPVSI